jgi:hypothetical protein
LQVYPVFLVLRQYAQQAQGAPHALGTACGSTVVHNVGNID